MRTPDVRTLVMSDGRTIDFVEYGTPTGTPVLAIHDATGSRVTWMLAHDAAIRHGIRLIAPDLSELLASSEQFEGTPRRRGIDLIELGDALNLERFALMGLGEGANVAVALGMRHPSRICAIALLSRLSEIRRHRRHRLSPPTIIVPCEGASGAGSLSVGEGELDAPLAWIRTCARRDSQ